MTRRTFWLSLALLVTMAATGRTNRAEEVALAIGGYDPVAYFTDSKAVPGRAEHELVWNGARWRFATAAHRDLFARDPERYAPQYDGYCAMGVASNEPHKDIVDPHAWIIFGGRLYLTHSAKALDKFREKLAENIKRADTNWHDVEQQTVIYDGFPNVNKK
jgi:YHS domain